MNIWTMHVENFGKIKTADIETAPMTLFVGENNSGKSYLMTLLYGLFTVKFYYEQYTVNDQSENYLNCVKFIDNMYNTAEQMDDSFRKFEMNEEDVRSFEGVLNELLSINKDKIVKNLLNKPIDIGCLSLEFKRDNKYELMYNVTNSHNQEKVLTLLGVRQTQDLTISPACQAGQNDKRNRYFKLISFIIEYMVCGNFDAPVYFPTARTGYILTYKALIESALRDKFNLDTAQKNLLTRPNSDFLIKFSGIAGDSSKDSERKKLFDKTQAALHIIEQNIIKGQVSISELPAHEILYQPKGTDMQLPMFVTSGVVTEMTPFLLFFKNEFVQTVLVEEPESSLHPQLQCEMARVMVRLVSQEIPVVATTHSDIILQHINNMIKLASSSNRSRIADKLGYEECDWIERDQVNVYQFDVDGSQQTTVTKLSCGAYGFEVMTFYDTLELLNF